MELRAEGEKNAKAEKCEKSFFRLFSLFSSFESIIRIFHKRILYVKIFEKASAEEPESKTEQINEIICVYWLLRKLCSSINSGIF